MGVIELTEAFSRNCYDRIETGYGPEVSDTSISNHQ